MAEGERASDNSWESWLGGWVQTAKEKSSSALEMVKKDLAEFTCTIQKDTEKAVEMTKESLNKENTTHATNRVKAGLTSFLDNISRVLVIPPDDDYIPMKVAPDGSGLYDRGKARLHAIQLDASTYMDAPEGSPEQYSMWLESFNMDEHKGEISELLVSKVEVRALYTKLVPSEVSHAEFWQRYFYRVHQLHCDEARKQALMKRADQTKGDSFNWDDDDDDWSGAEDDEDNHSDWEKMPRPSQLLAEKITPESTQQSEKQVGEFYAEPCVEKHAHVDSSSEASVTACKAIGTEAEVKVQQKVDVVEEIFGTSVAVVAASSVPSQNDLKADNMASTELSSEVTASRDIHEASEDVLCHPKLQMPSADLWSLHIPNDNASASHSGQDNEYIEASVLEPGSPLDIYRPPNEVKSASIDSDSCAAGGDVSSAAADKPGVTMADGASGTADVEAVLATPHQAVEPSPDVSAASVYISDNPVLSQVSGEGMSIPGINSGEEFAHVAEQNSEMTTTYGAKFQGQPTSACPIASIVESVPSNDTVIPTCDKTAVSSVPEAVSTTSDNVSQALDNSNRKNDVVPEIAKVSHQNETLVHAGLETVVVPEAADGGQMKEVGMRLKGDMVVVGDRDSPLSTESNDTKEIGLEEDWEQDFDIEITEDDLRTAENIAKQLGENLNSGDDDWENWE